MAQTLLANRFNLEFHRDTEEMPAYVVSVVKGGHKLKESEATGPMELKPTGNGSAAFSRVTLTQLIEMSSSILQGVVVDETGLKGSYDFKLDLSSFMNGDSRRNSLDDAIGILVRGR